MDCREAGLLIQPYLDGALNKDKAESLAEHLAGCDTCAGELALQERLSFALRKLGRETEQAPPELSRAVMSRLQGERRNIYARLPLTWRQAVAAAAAFLVLAGGSAGITAGLKMADTGKMLGYDTTSDVNTPDVGDTLPVNGDIAPEPVNLPGSTGAVNNLSSPQNSSPVSQLADGTGIVSSPSTTSPPADGTNVLLSSGMEIITTTLRVSSADLAADGARVVAQAAELGAKAQTFSEQNVDKNSLIMRITIASDKAHSLIGGITGTGTLITRQDESRDITSLYNETLIKYYDLQARICTSQDSVEQQQMETTALSYKQQLDAWEAEAGKRIIILILESN
jgi:anti-sigma factor (TIGR02949 family)